MCVKETFIQIDNCADIFSLWLILLNFRSSTVECQLLHFVSCCGCPSFSERFVFYAKSVLANTGPLRNILGLRYFKSENWNECVLSPDFHSTLTPTADSYSMIICPCAAGWVFRHACPHQTCCFSLIDDHFHHERLHDVGIRSGISSLFIWDTHKTDHHPRGWHWNYIEIFSV